MALGRPTKYSSLILKKAREYLDTYESLGDFMPTVQGLCLHVDINRDTAYEWGKPESNKEDFSDILDELMLRQHQVLTNKGLMGVFNPALTKLFLTKHGYSDKVETKDTSKELADFDDDELDAYIAQRQS